MARHRNDGWVPQQHGAWAMLVVPYLLGAIGLVRSGGTGPREWVVLPLLFVTWMIGYFAFNAATLWLKARPRRRPAFVRPILTYGAGRPRARARAARRAHRDAQAGRHRGGRGLHRARLAHPGALVLTQRHARPARPLPGDV